MQRNQLLGWRGCGAADLEQSIAKGVRVAPLRGPGPVVDGDGGAGGGVDPDQLQRRGGEQQLLEQVVVDRAGPDQLRRDIAGVSATLCKCVTGSLG